MLSDSHSSGSDVSSLIDFATTEGSSDLLAFLSQLLENVGENIATLVVVTIVETGTSQEVACWPKKHSVLKKIVRQLWSDSLEV